MFNKVEPNFLGVCRYGCGFVEAGGLRRHNPKTKVNMYQWLQSFLPWQRRALDFQVRMRLPLITKLQADHATWN